MLEQSILWGGELDKQDGPCDLGSLLTNEHVINAEARFEVMNWGYGEIERVLMAEILWNRSVEE